jgi:hypothetical protein
MRPSAAGGSADGANPLDTISCIWEVEFLDFGEINAL